MRLFFIIIFFIIAGTATSQQAITAKMISEQEIQYPPKDTIVVEEVFNVCIFPEGPSVDIEKWTAYLNDSLILDDAALDTIPPGIYKVFARFEVGESGKLSNISILKDPGYGLGERVKKVISNCKGIWKPVIDKNGQVIRNYRVQPIIFLVEESCEELPKEFML